MTYHPNDLAAGAPVDETTLLREAVDALTNPTYTKVDQDGRITRLEHPPLLDQLHTAIREAMAATQGDQTSKHTRGVLDVDALHLFTVIASQISGWAYQAGAPHRGTPAATLRAWFVVWCQSVREPAADRFHRAVLTRWAGQIRSKLDPPDEKILPYPCPHPECVQGFDAGRPVWWDRSAREARLFPLVVTYRRDDGPRLVENARARCRACGASWSVRELQYELEQEIDMTETTNHTNRSE